MGWPEFVVKITNATTLFSWQDMRQVVCRTFILAGETDVHLILQLPYRVASGKNNNRYTAFRSRSSSASSQDSFSSGSYSGKHFLVYNEWPRLFSPTPGFGFPGTVAISPYSVMLDEKQLDRKKLTFCCFSVPSVSDPDPDTIRSVVPYPDSETGSGSRRVKITHKIEKS